MQNQFGLYFPLVFDEGKLVDPKVLDSIDASIRHIMVYAPNGRFFNNQFGAGLERFLGLQASSYELSRLESHITLSVNMWEPRIQLQGVQVTADPDGVVRIVIDCFVPSINQKVEFNYAV